ncbi:MAG: hypothetical protein FWG68_03650 [Defluviitaleaceae bacterium]|nr:hypothetical protein [Defluviitaleaceae bacterium]
MGMTTIKSEKSIAIKAADEKTALLAEAHNKASERNQQMRRRRRPVEGTVRLSNTDSLGRAARVRRQLFAKIGEIMASDLESEIKQSLSRNVQMQLDRVDKTIRQIRRRKRAEEEEKIEKARAERNRREEERDELLRLQREEARRRRRRDLQTVSIAIRRDFLLPAEKGGLDPNIFPLTTVGMPPAATFDIAGQTGTIADIPAANADMVDLLL